MPRLIDANALKKKAAMHGHAMRPLVTAYHMCVSVHDIDDAPTIEAEPVKHGRWRDNTFCTNCGGFAEDASGHIVMSYTDYCPFCGAKMDGGAENA